MIRAPAPGSATMRFMRLWTLHPRYLDPAGLTALWREGLLARKVLLGRTRGYRHHPQLLRFRHHPRPIAAINSYLAEVRREAVRRGYAFDGSKVGAARTRTPIPESTGQVQFEWTHLRRKLSARNGAWLRRIAGPAQPAAHPLFRIAAGPPRSPP